MASAAISLIKSNKLTVLPMTIEADIDNNEMEDNLQTINNEVKNSCSLMLISEKGNDLIRIIAVSYEPKLDANAWVDYALKMVNGKIIEFNNTSPIISAKIQMTKSDFNATKEKENALAGAYTFLRKIGLVKEEEEEGVGNLLEELGL